MADTAGPGAGWHRGDGASECREPERTGKIARDESAIRRTGGSEMSLDLLTYADEHRCRVRNLHDGDSVPPTRRPLNGRRRMVYRAADDRHNVIICRDGYVAADDGPGDNVAFCVLCRSSRALQARLRLLDRLGATITQLGDAEAAGHAPASQIGEVLEVLHAYRRRETPVGARVPGPESTQSGRTGVDVHWPASSRQKPAEATADGQTVRVAR